MWKFCDILFIVVPLTLVKSQYDVLYSNGWVPISSDIAYNQVTREYTQAPVFTTTDVQVTREDVIKVVSPQIEFKQDTKITETTSKQFEDECSNEDPTNCPFDKIQNMPPETLETGFLPNVIQVLSKRNESFGSAVRKTRKLENHNFQNHVKTFTNERGLNRKAEVNSEMEDKLLSRKVFLNSFDNISRYEVTENSDPSGTDLEEIIQEKGATQETGYQYELPKNKNATNSLFQILAKYNIRTDDKLSNYALSRRHQATNPLTESIPHTPIQSKFPYRYNNLNHLPVDPILAVFLSNYGYYIQGLYGVQNNYNNLYGYLASNNIHNNRPFGLYKLFSDTDSSH